MKRLYRYKYCLIFLIFLFSCEKSLDLAPIDKYSEATFFETVGQFELFATQFYGDLPTAPGQTARDVASDILVDWSPSNISNGTYSAEPESGLWEGSYSRIRNTTYLIDKVENASEDLKPQVMIYLGEAKFFRAMAYFNLLVDFGGVPIIDQVLDLDDTDLLYGARDTREAVATYIFQDIDDAISNLPLEKDISSSNKGRVSKEAALALKARMGLFEGTWRKFRGQDGNQYLDKAIDASGQVISGGQYELFDRRDVLGDQSYKYFFILDKAQSNTAGLTKADQSEYIFVNKFDNDTRPASARSAHLFPSVTKKFADLFLCTDGLPIDKSPLFQGRLTVNSEYENRDLRMVNILQKPFTQFWSHYPPEYIRTWSDPFAGGNTFDLNFNNTTRTGYFATKFRPEIAGPYAPDYPVIRLAEVLLINAEAKFERNGTLSDSDLDNTINKLRARTDLPALTNAFVAANGLDMQTEIRRERTIELFLEGFRFDDLRRWKTSETEMPMGMKGVLWEGTQYDTDPQWANIDLPLDEQGYVVVEPASQRQFNEKHYLFPIPTRQILLNPEIEQNPGW